MNKKEYITPAIASVDVESSILALSIPTGSGSGAGMSNSLDGDASGSGFDEVQEFDWRN